MVTLVGATSVVGGASPPDLVAVARADADRGASIQVAATPPAPASDPAAEVVERTNAVRAQHGLAPLQIHPQMMQAAQAHSNDQAAVNRMSHTGSNGSTMAVRVDATGYAWSRIAENVAAGQGTAQLVTDAWLDSPGHRANMLNADLVHVGVAVTTSPSGTPYWTMVLATPR
ncbi:MAG: hypothetical protein CL424_15535 [Acidimicrobiaceae bacterium]|nr:hypothetical protein [Acidimicrobiaceae bacterium]